MRWKHWLFCATAAIAVVAPLTASAQVALISPLHEGKPDEVPVTPLVLKPAPQPRQALRYRLLPDRINIKPGNAAVLYYKYALTLKDYSEWDEDHEKISDWLELPLSELPRDEAAAMLAKYGHIIEGLSFAAVRDRCQWELPLGEKDFISILLPGLNSMRGFARLLAVQARVQIADGELEEAIRTLQTGYAMGRHLADGQTLIHGLVGIAVCSMMSSELQPLIQQPDSPNMYWALTSLPRPMVDLRSGIETEMNLLHYTFPELRQIDDKRHGMAYWQNFTDQLAERLSGWIDVSGGPEVFDSPLTARLGMTVLALRGYPMARQALIDQGRTPEQVDAMPVPQVVAIYTLQTYNEFRDDQFKWFMVPYHQGREHAAEMEKRLGQEARQREIVPLASLLLPAISAARLAVARNDRELAILRTIEAIRMYGATHDGRLPGSLDDIQAVPVPIDPVSGQPFLYENLGEKALLKTPPAQTSREKQYARRYEIRFL